MLDAKHLSVSYGQHRALDDVSVQTNPGEIVVILGANGAGKTTLLKAIGGLVPCSGQITMDGQAISGIPPHDIVESGLALVPEGRGIFGELSVVENLTLGAYATRARSGEVSNLNRVFALFPKLNERRHQMTRTMSGGEQQMVAIGRALMSAPSVLMLDEPSLGLSPLLCTELFKALRTVRDTGVGVLLVEQNARQSLAIADRAYLLENGHIVGEGPAEQMKRDPAVQEAYLGGASGSTHTPAIIRRGSQGRAANDTDRDSTATHRPQDDLIRDAVASLGSHNAAAASNGVPTSDALQAMVDRATNIQQAHIAQSGPAAGRPDSGLPLGTTIPNLDHVLADIEAAAEHARRHAELGPQSVAHGARRPRVHIISPGKTLSRDRKIQLDNRSTQSDARSPTGPEIPVFRKPKIEIYRRRSADGPLEREE